MAGLFKKVKNTKLSSNSKKALEGLLNAIQINLENNYKDLAIKARNDTEKLMEELRLSGELSGKLYDTYKKKLDMYTNKMQGYHH